MTYLEKHKDLIRKEIIDLADDGPIDLETWKNLVANTYERNYLFEFLTDEAILHVCVQYINNVTTKYSPTYESTIVHKLFPIVCSRLKD